MDVIMGRIRGDSVRVANRVSLGFTCKVILLFVVGDPILSTLSHTISVRRKKATLPNVQIRRRYPRDYGERVSRWNNWDYGPVNYTPPG